MLALRARLASFVLASFALAVACSSSSSSTPSATGADASTDGGATSDAGGGTDAVVGSDAEAGPPLGNGPVSGPADPHCTAADGGKIVQETDPASCFVTPDGGGIEAYPPTLYNAEGDDDDCKYHVKWSSTALAENTDVTFTVTVTKRTDDSPATSAAPRIEAYLDDTHPAPTTSQKPAESPAGTYTVGPIRFDAPGRWTVRFHLYGTCTDAVETTPHAHAAFFVDVP